MTKTLFIEVRDERGLTEVWDPDDATMASLGWIRADLHGEEAKAFAQKLREPARVHPGPLEKIEAVYVYPPVGPQHGAGTDDDPEPTRYDVPDLDTKTNGHHAAEAELGDCACHSPNVDQSPGGAYFCRGCGRGVGYLNRPAPEAEKLLLTDRLAQLLPERLGKGEGAAMATVAVLIEVLSERLGKVF